MNISARTLLIGVIAFSCSLFVHINLASVYGQTIPPSLHLPLVRRDVIPTATAARTLTVTPTFPALPTLTPTATSTPFVLPTPTRLPAQCDSSYPTVCIPPPPPDLDCWDIPYRNFPVLPPDPHRFDGDEDGIGCETK